MAKLTALQVEKARPRKNNKGEFLRTEIPDAGQPGLYLVVQPNGYKSWAVRYRRKADGQSRKFTLDTFCSLATAHKLARKALDEIEEGGDPAAAKQIRKETERTKSKDNDDTFDAVARQFINRYARPKNRSWNETARLLGLKPDPDNGKDLLTVEGGLADRRRWGKRGIGEITKRDIIALLDEISDPDGRDAPYAANRMLAAVRKLFNWAAKRDLVGASPCIGIEKPGPETKRSRVLSDEEIRWFWQACEALSAPSADGRKGESLFGRACELLLLTGQRRAEVGEMVERELDMDAALWTIPGARTKNKHTHEVPLSAAALAVIGSAPRVQSAAGYLFTTNGDTPMSGWSKAKDQIDELMLLAARKDAQQRGDNRCDVEPWRLHDLRRTAATKMADIGIAPHIIEAVLNHISGAKAGIAGIYNHAKYRPEKRVALEAWAREVERIVSGKAGNVVPMVRSPASGG